MRKRRVVQGLVVLVAAAFALPFVYGTADAGAEPEVIIVGPSKVKIDNGGTVVIRGAYIKGNGGDIDLSLKWGAVKGVTIVQTNSTRHGNVIMSDFVIKTVKKGKGAVTLDLAVRLTARDGKDHVADVTKFISVTINQ